MIRFLFTSLTLFLFSTTALAIENLGPCNPILASQPFKIDVSHSVHLTENQVLVRGNLEAFWETGMEDQVGWTIVDTTLVPKVKFNPFLALHFLQPKDQVFLLDPNGQVMISGYYGEVIVPGMVTIEGESYPVSPNKPLLFADPDLRTPVLSTDLFEAAFKKKGSAVAIINMAPAEKARLWENLKDIIHN